MTDSTKEGMKKSATGRWEVLELPWYETNITNCSLCGKMIPHRMWIVEVDDEERKFCNSDCEQLYLEYWLPTHAKRTT